MAFAAGLFLWALIGVPLILLLAALRRRPREVEVPSLVLWRQVAERIARAPADARARRSPLALLLTLLAFAMAVLAAASPVVDERAPRPRNVVILADRSVIASLPAAASASASASASDASGWTSIVAWIEQYAAQLDDRDQLQLELVPSPSPSHAPTAIRVPRDAAASLRATEVSHAASRIDDTAAAWLAAPPTFDQLIIVSCAAPPSWWPRSDGDLGGTPATWITMPVEPRPVITHVDADEHGMLAQLITTPGAGAPAPAFVRAIAAASAESALLAARSASAADASTWRIGAFPARDNADDMVLTAWFDWAVAPPGFREADWFTLRAEPAGAPPWIVRRWRSSHVVDDCGMASADGGAWARTLTAVLPGVELVAVDDVDAVDETGAGVVVAVLTDSAERVGRGVTARAPRIVWGQPVSDEWARVGDALLPADLDGAALEADPEAAVLRGVDVSTLPFDAPRRLAAAQGGQIDAAPLVLVLRDGERVPLVARVRRGRETCWMVNAPAFDSAAASAWRTTLATWTSLANLLEIASGRPILDPPSLEAAVAGDAIGIPRGALSAVFTDADAAQPSASTPIPIADGAAITIDRAGLLTFALENSGTTQTIPVVPGSLAATARAASATETTAPAALASALPAGETPSPTGLELLPLLLALAALAVRATRRD